MVTQMLLVQYMGAYSTMDEGVQSFHCLHTMCKALFLVHSCLVCGVMQGEEVSKSSIIESPYPLCILTSHACSIPMHCATAVTDCVMSSVHSRLWFKGTEIRGNYATSMCLGRIGTALIYNSLPSHSLLLFLRERMVTLWLRSPELAHWIAVIQCPSHP